MTNPYTLPPGSRFGRLVVLERAPGDGRRGERLFLCRCDCGNETVVRSSRLREGITVSCGCYGREVNVRHGHTKSGRKSVLYSTWGNMLRRCQNSNVTGYEYYGGRGITVCERWRGPFGFENFLADMGEKPGPEYSIDRIDNDGNYEPSNCRWATSKEQTANQRLCSEAAKQRMSAAQYERFARNPVSDETRARQSVAAKRRWARERSI